MELINKEEQQKQNNGKKIVAGALAITVALMVIVIISICILKQQENSKLKLIVDGKNKTLADNMMITDSNTGINYFSISKVANLVGYEYYNGEYKQYTEDKSKCYVECENELAMFELNSNIMYKNNTEDKLNFDSYIMDKNVTSYNGELYITQNAIQSAFNTRVIYNESNQTIYFETLPYLVNYYTDKVKEYGYTDISEDFITQKTLINNLLVVKKEDKYGVISTKDFTKVIGNKYDSMIYLENTKEFIVSNDDKTGTLSIDGNIQIGLRYDEIGLIDGEIGLYYVKNDGFYGVLNKSGKVIVYIEYDDIGIDRKIFPIDNIKNNMFLYKNCIPLKKNGKWGIADKNGNIILNFEYDQLGYAEVKTQEVGDNSNNGKNNTADTTVKDKSINNVVVIPSIQGIVVGKQEKYGVINSIGKNIVVCDFDKIYSITNERKDEYFLEKNGRTVKLTKYLDDNKINVETPTTPNKQNTLNITNTVIDNDSNSTTNKNESNESIVIM